MRRPLKMMAGLCAGILTAVLAAGSIMPAQVRAAEDAPIILRVCNWEEYIDEGEWGEDEVIDLESGDIFGENALTDDFETWFYETYHRKVIVEYSTFGTNEELYSQLTLGDVYDLVCPSDYMIMKLMAENKVQPLSESFFDESNELNYYWNGVSPYIRQTFEENEIKGEPWSKYAAGYMWGTTGFVYNPEEVDEEKVLTWSALTDPDLYRQITIKDNVRDALFPTMGILQKDLLLSDSFTGAADYRERLVEVMNDTSVEMVALAEEKLKEIRQNVYSFETDSGKADMVTGKVVANLQWSGDAVYTMDQAEEDDVELYWATPLEVTNLWFDGWCMLKAGIEENKDKQLAAEAFINFLSRPDNAIRNMYYIGYTSVVSGAEDGRVFEYLEWNYAAEDDEEDVIEYPLGYFFSGDDEDEDYVITAPAIAAKRQLSAQYPDAKVINRSAFMQYFDLDSNARINQMWINIRCFNLSQITAKGWIVTAIVILALVFAVAGYFIVKNMIVMHRVKMRHAAR